MAARVIVLALGTRGDVEPLAHLAVGLHRSDAETVLCFATHAAHEVPSALDQSHVQPVCTSVVQSPLSIPVPKIVYWRALNDIMIFNKTVHA